MQQIIQVQHGGKEGDSKDQLKIRKFN